MEKGFRLCTRCKIQKKITQFDFRKNWHYFDNVCRICRKDIKQNYEIDKKRIMEE